MVLSMSPQDGSIKPLPADLEFVELPSGSVRFSFPDGSVRELLPGASGEGRMITTLADGTRIQSDLTFGEGQVSVSSISSTGEKTLLSLNENGANLQRVTADGQISNFIPDSAPELMQSYREAEAFAQAEELRQQEEFQNNQEFGGWNNYGKPTDWQPEQNWQPPQGNWQPPQGDYFPQPMAFQPPQGNWQPPQGDYFPKPDYAGNNWVDNGNGSWIAPIQPDAFQQPMGYAPPQQFGEWNNYGKPADWQPEQNWQPPQSGYFPKPDYAGNNWVDNGNGSWIAPIQPDAFQQPMGYAPPQQFGEWNNYGKPADWQPEQNWQPPQGNWQPPQGDYFPQPMAYQPPQGNWQPPQGDYFPQPMGYAPPQQFGEWNNYGKPADWQPEQNWQPPQGNWQPPQGDYFPKPDYAGNNWVDNGNGSWIAPIQPDAFQQPMGYAPPQQFGTGFMQPGAAFGLDPQPEPPHTMMGGNWQPPQGNWQPPQFGSAQGFADPSGFAPPPFKDASGFPVAAEFSNVSGNQEMFDHGASPAETSSGNGTEFDTAADQDQIPNQ
jgi:hypothetical protein